MLSANLQWVRCTDLPLPRVVTMRRNLLPGFLSSVATTRSAFSAEKQSGGFNFKTLCAAAVCADQDAVFAHYQRDSGPSSAAGSSVARLRTSSTPTNRPSPRARDRPAHDDLPQSAQTVHQIGTDAQRVGLAILLNGVEHRQPPTAHDTGLPPNVLKYSMPLANEAAMAGVVTTATSGWPLPIGFAHHDDVGTTFCVFKSPEMRPDSAKSDPALRRRYAASSSDVCKTAADSRPGSTICQSAAAGTDSRINAPQSANPVALSGGQFFADTSDRNVALLPHQTLCTVHDSRPAAAFGAHSRAGLHHRGRRICAG